MSKLIRKTVSCIFILLTLGLLNTCDDPNNPFSNPFSNNLGTKVVVEPPTIWVTSPDNNSFIKIDGNGYAVITGRATAYIKIQNIEWKVFRNSMYNQPETGWSSEGVDKGGDIKNTEWTLTFDPKIFNEGRDGFVRMQFRVTDSSAYRDSVEYIFIFKSRPTEIIMANPSGKIIIDDEAKGEPSKINWKGEITGQAIDVKGLRPGFPQIQIWPADGSSYGFSYDPNDPDSFEDDSNWGWASLFLPGIGIGEPSVGEDKIDADMGTHFGSYANRYNRRVVITSSFSFRAGGIHNFCS